MVQQQILQTIMSMEEESLMSHSEFPRRRLVFIVRWFTAKCPRRSASQHFFFLLFALYARAGKKAEHFYDHLTIVPIDAPTCPFFLLALHERGKTDDTMRSSLYNGGLETAFGAACWFSVAQFMSLF